MLEIKEDKRADAVYVKLQDKPVAYTQRLDDNRIVDYAQDNTVVGVDLLSISEGVDYTGLPNAEEIRKALEGRPEN
jgi:uncharacterized protein YuzE